MRRAHLRRPFVALLSFFVSLLLFFGDLASAQSVDPDLVNEAIALIRAEDEAVSEAGGPTAATPEQSETLRAAEVPVTDALSAPTSDAPMDTGLVVIGVIAGLLVVGSVSAGAFVTRRSEHRGLASLPNVDALTGLANRRSLDGDLMLRRQSSPDDPIAVLMIDVDRFKRFNDDHGHPVGDEVLRAVADLFAAQVREDDVVYRYGGEEFCVLLPGASTDEAFTIAERLRLRALGLELSVPATVTVSVGLSHGSGDQLSDLVETADAALDVAKNDGRNRTAVAGR